MATPPEESRPEFARPPVRLRLAHFLKEHHTRIIEAWASEVRRLPHAKGLSRPALYNHIPQLLDSLTESLSAVEEGRSPAPLDTAPDEHALDRLDQGCDLREMVGEYSVLRSTIERLWEESEPSPPSDRREYFILDQTIDEAVAASVDRYSRSRDRTLIAVDRISAAALESGNLNVFLPRLLQVLTATTEAVDSAVILLSENGRLYVRASTGLPEEEMEGFSLAIGEGLAGVIAAEGKPREVRHAASAPEVKTPGFRSQSTRALYGVPMLSDSKVVGVAMMGSRTAYEFSTEDRILFRTMANRATALIVQHQLLYRERKARILLDTLLTASPVGVAFIDCDLRYVQINPALAAIHGKPIEEHLGRTVQEVLPHKAHVLVPLLRQVLESGTPAINLELVEQSPRGDNGERFFLASFYPMRTPAGELLGIGGAVMDVTESRRTQKELDRRAAELEAIIESIPEAVYVGDMSGITRANKVALEQLGFANVEELNQNVASLADRIQTRDVETGRRLRLEEEPFVHALGGKTYAREVLVRHIKTGEDRVVRSSSAPVVLSGQVVGAVAVNVDITKQKHTEAELKQTAQFREQFISILGHDLRNPLGAIRASVDLLLRQEELKPGQLKGLQRILKSAERMTRMISDVLDFARGRLGGGFPLQRQRVNLHDICRRVVEELHVANPDRELVIDTSGNGLGAWDPERVAQAISNLVANAIQHGAPDAPVKVSIRDLNGDVLLEVTNQGTPIPADLIPVIFEPFRGGRPASEHGGQTGLGLGLFIVREIARAHGARVDVRSTLEEGTTFFVRWPRQSSASTGGHGAAQ